MKAFDLEKAIAGEPVVLRDGSKAFVKFEVPKELRENNFADIVGFRIRGNEFIVEEWDIDGVARSSCGHRDIVGMYEEPRPTVTLTLPCPLKSVTVGQRVFYLDLNKQCERICAFLFQKDSTYHFNLLKNGGIFSTEEDAQAWFDAMKNARR
ncbi:pyruvate kinase [Pasteurella multocida]|uniref:Pyruvate kinase n=1 Tax=Pasteurella multocida TaxID=747 RepID=A0AAW8VAI7_PASMD|nr:pyruvate kinase [Pasteurella multocida]MDH7436183.1 pyruvate kinase [Pasteurella multocida]MDH7440017.1 pyruvate kinase [Pasteurella multocida]MDT3453539.1 pyruvate kinase [Pasteurella multocida]MDY0447185.1 pyruvate kinase [Pasteurella multocida]MDY0449475.1 pyruvate kinase [Pasteurella multocida]